MTRANSEGSYQRANPRCLINLRFTHEVSMETRLSLGKKLTAPHTGSLVASLIVNEDIHYRDAAHEIQTAFSGYATENVFSEI